MLAKRLSRKWQRVAALVFLSGLVLPRDGAFAPTVSADSTPQSIPFSQDWSSTGQITGDDNWAGVPGIVGFRGDDLTTSTGTDPQTILADGSGTPVDVIANQANPNTQTQGGVGEFGGIANPVDNQPLVQLRIITTNAVGSDEWIGILVTLMEMDLRSWR